MNDVTIEKISQILRCIIGVRDYHAEHGEYPTNLEADQCFDDWAADMAQQALELLNATELPKEATQRNKIS